MDNLEHLLEVAGEDGYPIVESGIRRVMLNAAARVGFKPKIPNCKNINRPECYAGYETRFDNWCRALREFSKSVDEYNRSKRWM